MLSLCKHFLTLFVKVISHWIDCFMQMDTLTFCSMLSWNCTSNSALSSLSIITIWETFTCSFCSWLQVLYWWAICHSQIWTLLGLRFLLSWLFSISKLVSTFLSCKETNLNDRLEFFKLSCQQSRLYCKLVGPNFQCLFTAACGSSKQGIRGEKE